MTAWRRVVNSGAGVGAGAGGKLARVQVETPADTTTTGPGTHQPARTISSVKVTYFKHHNYHGIYTTQVLIELIE